ncbi:MAG: hypothetical protein ACI9TH_000407 [Kiritimatiellia bacterium]|jgi:hypothetical protein
MKWIAITGLAGLFFAGCMTTPNKSEPSGPQTDGQPVSLSGETLFSTYCSACHGTRAIGDGPIAKLLKSPPPDLTTFARRRNGQFSYVELARFIDGRQDVSAHGSRIMPVWGKQFARTEEDPGERESVVSGNLLELVLYLEAIQQK